MRLGSFVCTALILGAVLWPAARLQAAQTPNEVRAQMRPGGISLRFESYKIGPRGGAVWGHLYVVPKGHSPEVQYSLPEPRNGPVKSEHITTGASLLPSPFFLELFTRVKDRWQRLNSVRFTEDKDVNKVVIRWLEPARRRGPILALHFGYAHWHAWQIIIFPHGLAKPAVTQQFLFGGEGGTGVVQRLDRTDKRGFLMIREDLYEPNEKTAEPYDQTQETRFYHWDGAQFTDREARYFVIAASLKTRQQAREFISRKKLGDAAEILASSRYARLRGGSFIVVVERNRSRPKALETAAFYRKEGTPCYVKQAF